jgi:hypothetical protein
MEVDGNEGGEDQRSTMLSDPLDDPVEDPLDDSLDEFIASDSDGNKNKKSLRTRKRRRSNSEVEDIKKVPKKRSKTAVKKVTSWCPGPQCVDPAKLEAYKKKPAWKRLSAEQKKHMTNGSFPEDVTLPRHAWLLKGPMYEPKCGWKGYEKEWQVAVDKAISIVQPLEHVIMNRRCKIELFKKPEFEWLSKLITYDLAFSLGYDGKPYEIPALLDFFESLDCL